MDSEAVGAYEQQCVLSVLFGRIFTWLGSGA